MATRWGSAGTITGHGTLDSDTTNTGALTVQADSQVLGNYSNDGTTTIQSGTLSVLGALTNNGMMVGDFAGPLRGGGPRAAGDGVFVEGDFVAGPGATLTMPSGEALFGVGGDWNVAIDSNDRFDMSGATLRMVGLGPVQELEVMSVDVGSDRDALNPTIPGHYPIGTLRIGPTPTTVRLVDNHDNDGQGQGVGEALYANELIVETGATLITDGRRVYAETITLDGTVDDPGSLVVVPPPCPDLDGDNDTDVFDFAVLAGSFGTSVGDPGYVPEADLDGSGTINVLDFGLFGAYFGCGT